MKLVIVESPAKAKTIQKYLGKGFVVKSSKGHVVDLPKSVLGVDVEASYEPSYVVTKPEVVKDLKKSMKGVTTLVLAVDPDREGEAIGWHVAQQLGVIKANGKLAKKSVDLQRIVFTEITKDAVQSAAQHPRDLDMDLVNAQQARRILDRLVGYKLSPLLWKKIRYGLSAGRVQSVAVRLIVDRERERDAFNADEYWRMRATLNLKKGGKPKLVEKMSDKTTDEEEEQVIESTPGDIDAELVKLKGEKISFSSQSSVKNLAGKLLGEEWQVAGVEQTDSKRYAQAPFSTSVLQQDAANRLGFAAKRTMQIAQKLYEAGHITYMRTDSITMSSQAVESARKYISSQFGAEYLPQTPNVYKTKSKVAQEAHEAIRPTHFEASSKTLKLDVETTRLYELIRSRAIASQMSPARFLNTKIIISAGDAEFHANGRVTQFAGFMKAYPDAGNDRELPALEKGQILHLDTLLSSQHFTQPPARFSEATLVKELEKLGIGRPSTYAPIIQTILARKYVEKEGRYFRPTDTGTVVTDLLVKHFSEIVDVDFTSGMEDDLDQIAEGKRDWVKIMDGFYKPFAANLKKKDKEISKEDVVVLGKSDEKCPECGSEMVIKLGKFGKFLSCTRFPDCMGMVSLTENGEAAENLEDKVKSEDFKSTYLPAPKTDDSRDYVLKRGRFGEFWAHPDYPKVKDAQPLELLPSKVEEIYGKPPQTDDGRDYLLKSGRFGKFWAHPDYPKVKDIVNIKKAKQGVGAFKKGKKSSRSKKSKK